VALVADYDPVELLAPGRIPRGRFRLVEEWVADHPWPLQTIELDRFLLYSPIYYHGRLPYGRSTGSSHRTLLLERVE
jgi:hypothetical protein